ncbi:circumsporozoite protein-like [Echeneis naucrates]|uniref:circumsporozoite protein-like n=1 Tax=Echeneis naucrates TaxID=173247 RepID=UPI0011141A08|nr:circumsporozoite protein-like [Echeneis naucrates]
MGNVLRAEVGSGLQTDPEEELRTRLANFVLLYDRHQACLQSGSQGLSAFPRVFSFPGAVVGGACGGLIGAPGGAVGAVGAAACGRLFGQITAVGATVGFFGGVLGGVVWGAFSGCVGGAVGGVHVVWFAVGLATGGAIGSIYGGNVGAAGGALGGGFGAFCGSRFAGCLVGDSAEQTKKAADELNRTVQVLVHELETIQRICRRMSDAQLTPVSVQTQKTLNAAKETDPGRFPDEVTEELKAMRTQAAKLLASS